MSAHARTASPPGDAGRPVAGAWTDIGRTRERNEDAFLVLPPLFAVADGMGGAKAGDVASNLALRVLGERRLQHPKDVPAAFCEANRQVWDASVADPSTSGMGTTLTTVLIHGGSAAVGHVGDSRAYLLRNHTLRQLTADHTRVGDMMRAGIISADQASDHPQRNVLVRAIGTHPEVAVDTLLVPLAPGDKLLLCTDGVHGSLGEEEIRSIAGEEDSPDSICHRLVERANDKGGHDNATAVLIEMVGIVTPPPPARRHRLTMVAAATVILAAAGWFVFSSLRSPDVVPGATAPGPSPTAPDTFGGVVPDDAVIMNEVEVDLDATPPKDRALVWTGASGSPNLDLFIVAPDETTRVFHAGADGIGIQAARPGEAFDSVTPIDLIGGVREEVAFLVRPVGGKRAVELRIVGVGPRGPRPLFEARIRGALGLERRGRTLLVRRGFCCRGLALVVRTEKPFGQPKLELVPHDRPKESASPLDSEGHSAGTTKSVGRSR